METPETAVLRIAFATGTSPEKWFRRCRDRIPADLHTHALDKPLSALTDGTADMALVRLDSEESLPDTLHRIRLYDEAWGVAFEKDHVFSLSQSIDQGLLADETVLLTSTDVDELRQMLPVAATGAGVVVGPRTILKALAKKAVSSSDLVAEEGATEPLTKTAIWLVWPKADDDELRQEFVGIVQGRKQGSTRTQLGREAAKSAPKKLTAREKTLAKQARRRAASGVVKHAKPTAKGRSGRGGRAGGGRPRRRK
ncbi:MAG: LysR family transcriptional regulator [Corynebacterium sp.]|uniref:LysR family transcriptional regulator n=1 Tax=Corynebacterium sp. TaxID=1720 RepID=UPI0026DAD5A8|nr:LysR family transcriptional regulator [Corynebacterium sp.]MDO5030391.1 LysR family transcriptional regulator [Corynebacterium sp.]